MKTNAAMILALALGAVYAVKKLGLFKPGALNPTSRNNFVYQASGEIGLKLADMYPSVAERAVAEMLKVQPKKIAAGSGYEFSPASFNYSVPPLTAAGVPKTPAQMTSLELYRLQYGDGLMGGLGSNGRWLS